MLRLALAGGGSDEQRRDQEITHARMLAGDSQAAQQKLGADSDQDQPAEDLELGAQLALDHLAGHVPDGGARGGDAADQDERYPRIYRNQPQRYSGRRRIDARRETERDVEADAPR